MNKASGHNLKPIPWRDPFLDGVEVYESNSAASWALWDAAIRYTEPRMPGPREFADLDDMAEFAVEHAAELAALDRREPESRKIVDGPVE